MARWQRLQVSQAVQQMGRLGPGSHAAMRQAQGLVQQVHCAMPLIPDKAPLILAS
jgi:hypothetical protein